MVFYEHLRVMYLSIVSSSVPKYDYKTNAANEICFEYFINGFNETDCKINKEILETHIFDYPKYMGSALRAVRDETEYAKDRCGSDTVFNDLENIIAELDGFVDDYMYSLVKQKEKFELIITTSKNKSQSDSSENGIVFNSTIGIINSFIGLYSHFMIRKLNKISNDFESAYNEKPELQ